jgi:hypothetical protein
MKNTVIFNVVNPDLKKVPLNYHWPANYISYEHLHFKQKNERRQKSVVGLLTSQFIFTEVFILEVEYVLFKRVI